MFGDSATVNEILKCETTFDAKRLGYKVSGFNIKRRSADGYSVCLDRHQRKICSKPQLTIYVMHL